ncbi:MAG: Gfo/Idh/MocA family oxidoreductase [Phycisphaerae bacterium]|nr:Gfo/Idh/MocA family oxidoreductase [Phycisphaerae bacterium]
MSESDNPSRRDFLKAGGTLAAISSLVPGFASGLFAAENNTIQLALVGCGGRGTGAAGEAMSVKNGPVKLVAMADVFPAKMNRSFNGLKEDHSATMDVPEDRRFLGLDGYKKAMDCLRPGDVVILATPPAFRWVHFTYAIEKNLNVFMEKPVTVDGPTTRRMLKLAEESVKKNLKCGVGLMVRHCRGRQELKSRIDSGEIGDIVSMRAYRMGGIASACGPKPAGISETMYQIQRFHSFFWASGGMYSDYYIHQIDECSWMKGSWPVKAHAVGGRQFRGKAVDQNFDNYAVEYTYPDGAKLFYYGRNMQGCESGFASYVHGAKGCAIVSTSGHTPGKVRTFRGQNFDEGSLIWKYPQPEKSPYQLEWDDLIDAIRDDKPYNEVQRGAEASLVSSMGRMAAHVGRTVTFDEILNCKHEFAPNADKLTADGPAPVVPGSNGLYPQPQPGVLKDREY